MGKFMAGEALLGQIWVQGLDDTLHKFIPWLPQAHRNCNFRRAQLAIIMLVLVRGLHAEGHVAGR